MPDKPKLLPHTERFQDDIRRALPGAEILTIIPVLHCGWEVDPLAAVVTHDGRRVLITTDHGHIEVLTGHQAHRFLKERKREYADAARAAQDAARALSEPRLAEV